MQSLLNDIIVSNIAAFLLVFTRFGMALMVMPGVGDSFVNARTRLLFALAMSFVMTPFMASSLPPLPGAVVPQAAMLLGEAVTGLFLGTVMRVMITALDTAGSIASMQTGFSSVILFNPVTAGQGSLVGALYSSLGVALLLTMDLHHNLLAAVVESYGAFPVEAGMPDAGSLSEAVARTVSAAFSLGARIAVPFLVVGLTIQIVFGVLGRLMPQVQIFFLALPVQILLCLVVMAVTLSAGMIYWINHYDDTVMRFVMP